MKAIITALVAAAALPIVAATAQQMQHEQAAAPAAAGEPMVSGLGEMMALQQMRHIKLWFAGRAGNWELADYEVGELKEGFEDVTKLLGGDTVEKAIGPQITDIEKAIDAKNSKDFARAFDKLTAGCNGCHQTLNHAFIVIQRPRSLPYANQSFKPARK